ncbi:MAG TPA: LysM peptidoglycan-binding domain-containing protein [Acetobacteraceae bacterium]|nr:LysM peptidoglycan-binding domain-containing protein [Acetobacteraceae bacterium]
MTALAKLIITPEPASHLDPIEALFNPNTYSITKTVSWTAATGNSQAVGQTERRKNAPALQFGGGQSRSLSLDLFFDTTEETNDAKKDVRTLTNKIVKLTRIVRDLDPQRPPVCVVSWGKETPPGSDFPFTGVVTQLTQRFNLFLADGRPVRANLTLALTEYLDPTKDELETDPEFTTRLVKRGDSLSSIAAEVYRDPTQWRVIAEANRLDDPRRVAPGLRLNIPKIRPEKTNG